MRSMRSKINAFIACSSVLLAWVSTPSLTHARAPRPSYSTARVDVDASALEGEGSTMEKSVASLSRNEVAQAVRRDLAKHLTVVDKGAEVVVYVTLIWKDYETSHYGVRMEIRRGSSSQLVVVDECKLCDEEQLAAKVAGRVEDLLPYLVVETEGPEPVGKAEVEPEPVGVEPEPEVSEPRVEPEPVNDGPGYRRVGVAGYVGIGALALGAGVTLGGVILLLQDPTIRIPPNDTLVEEETQPRTLGTVLTAAGAGLLVSGVVLVVVDQTVLRKRRSQRKAAAMLHPSLSPAGFSISVSGRF